MVSPALARRTACRASAPAPPVVAPMARDDARLLDLIAETTKWVYAPDFTG